MKLAWSLQVTRGGKLRVDSTVVPTNIHHPTDSGLLEEGVRVLSRLLPRAKGVLGEATPLGQGAFRSRTRSIRRLAQRKWEAKVEVMQQVYGRLIRVAQQSLGQGVKVGNGCQPRRKSSVWLSPILRLLPVIKLAGR